MYNIYRMRIKLHSSYITPWQSDTIMGHLFWAIKYRYGEDRLEEILKDAEKNPVFIVSDAFEEGRYPKFNTPINYEMLEVSDTESYTKMKKIKKLKNVNLDEFNGFIEGKTLIEFFRTKLEKDNIKTNETVEQNTIHNQINRMTGTTVDNGLYTLNEKFIDGNLEIFFKVRKDYKIAELEEILRDFERSGFGKKSSSGKGSFKIIDFKKFDGFKKVKNGNGFIILSNYIPKKGDYEEVVYAETLTKYGKLGGEEAHNDIPFKRPFISYSKGGIFKSKNPSEIKGKMLSNIHLDLKFKQFGIPFILEVNLNE